MALDTRLAALIVAIGGDVKALRSPAAASGFTAWSDDPALITGTLRPTSGVLTLGLGVAAAARASGASVTVTAEVTTIGATLTSAQNLLGLYRSDGTTLTRIGVSADQSLAWVVLGVKTASITLSAAVNPGDVLYLAVLTVGVTTPTFRAAPAATLINAGTVKRRATLAAQTAMPASLTLSGLTAATQAVGVLVT